MAEDDGPGVPEWVVTYGDMMSLLLTFFIMLVSLSEVVADKKYRAVLNSIQQYVGYRTATPSPQGKSFPLNSMVSRLDTLGSFLNSKAKGGIRTEALPGEEMKVLRTREGHSLRIGESIEFEENQSEISEAGEKELAKIAEQLAGKPNKIEIQGYTRPNAKSTYGDLLRLSYERAHAVQLRLEELDIDPDRIRLTLMADVAAKQTSKDVDGPLEDRVDIVTYDAYAGRFIGPEPKSD